MQADAAESVSVEQWPLFGFALIKLRANEFLWFFRSHHLIMDGYSAPVVTRRLAEIYSAPLMSSTVQRCRESQRKQKGLRRSLSPVVH